MKRSRYPEPLIDNFVKVINYYEQYANFFILTTFPEVFILLFCCFESFDNAVDAQYILYCMISIN